MRRVIDVEELISKLYDPRVVHMDENGRVKREEVIMVINGLAEEGEERPQITDEQISDAFQVAIVNYWEEKSKYLTPPPSPCCDPQNKMEHGEWIDYQDDEYSYLANCSKCGYQMNTHEEHGYFNFCPNCGKAMRHRILDESVDGEGKDGNVKEGDRND